jgi:hypothetical protein
MAEHSSQTGQVKKVTLPSSIERVMWSKKLATAGGLVELDVFTLYIGNNSEIQIELSDGSGKTLGKYTERMAGSRFRAPIRVPAEAKEELFATVKLPKHGLQKKSESLRVVPPVQFSNVKWEKSEVQRGETLKLTAEVKGVPDGTDVTITVYEHDADGAHDQVTSFTAQIKNKKVDAEWEYEYHEDTDKIPSEEELHKSGKHYSPPEFFFRISIAGIAIDSGLIAFKDWIELELTEDGESVTDREYVLYCADGSERKGKLDRNGQARVEHLPPGPVRVDFAERPPTATEN